MSRVVATLPIDGDASHAVTVTEYNRRDYAVTTDGARVRHWSTLADAMVDAILVAGWAGAVDAALTLLVTDEAARAVLTAGTWSDITAD